MEYLDLYDWDRRPLNKKSSRGAKLKEGEYRLVVHACVFNDKNQMIIQQRQSTKKFGGLWDLSVGGGVQSGENSRQAIEREVFEEIGIQHDFSNERPYLTVNFDDGFDDMYIIFKNVSVEQLKLQPEEVQNAKWATKEEIIDKIKNNQFMPYHIGLIHALFDLQKNRGAFA